MGTFFSWCRLPPEEALNWQGKTSPRFACRALYSEEKIALTDENLLRVLELGYNTLVGDYPENESKMGIWFLPLHRFDAVRDYSPEETLKESLVKALKQAEEGHAKMVFYTEAEKGFSELNFAARKSILAFRGRAIWKLLANSPSFGTSSMPALRACHKEGELPLAGKRQSDANLKSDGAPPLLRPPGRNAPFAGKRLLSGGESFCGRIQPAHPRTR